MPQNEEKCKREGKTSPTAPTIMHGRGRCPHRPALPRYLSPVGRGDHTSPPGIAPQLMKKPCHCEGAPRPWRSASPAPRFLCLRRLPFFLRQKKGRKERRQNQGFGILFAAEVSSTSVSSYLADRDVQNLHLASYDLCGAIRWPLTRARAALTQQGNTLRLPCYAQHFLSSFRRGRCLHRPALPRSLSPIGRGDHTLPPGIAPQLMKKPCHCESAPRPWRSGSPSAAVFMSPTAPFLSAAKEREERTPPKPRFWNPFRG